MQRQVKLPIKTVSINYFYGNIRLCLRNVKAAKNSCKKHHQQYK